MGGPQIGYFYPGLTLEADVRWPGQARGVYSPANPGASVTDAMNAAATQDLRSTGLTPTLSTLLRGGPAPSVRAERMLQLLEAWRGAGSSRLDRDEDGAMDAGPAPAIMDAFYPRLVDAVLGGALGPQLAELKALEGASNSPRSCFSGGAINHVDHRGAHHIGPRRAKPRGRPQAPDVCTSLRQSLAPTLMIAPEPPLHKPT